VSLVHVFGNQENSKNARKFVCGSTAEKQEVEESQTTHQTLFRHARQSKSNALILELSSLIV
jgi:hypothetical protein